MIAYKQLVYSVIITTAMACTACHEPGGRDRSQNMIKPTPTVFTDSNTLAIDRSPMDMIYFPVDYPKEKMADASLTDPLARVIYSRPQRNGRILFADSAVTQNFIQHYGHEWRLGANEATEIEFFKPASVSGKIIPAGRYILYCIPYPDKWKIIFNNNLFSWGLHMDQTKDIAAIDIPVSHNNPPAEYFTMQFQAATKGCHLIMQWGDIKAELPIVFN